MQSSFDSMTFSNHMQVSQSFHKDDREVEKLNFFPFSRDAIRPLWEKQGFIGEGPSPQDDDLVPYIVHRV